MINRVRGTQDILQTELLRYLIKRVEKELKRYNFSYIETPLLEHTKLFIHSLGSQTDIVSKEMYTFAAEQEEESICLRPEMTASTIRAYSENGITARPWKVYSHGPVFRRERPQKGRWRQFSQFNIELINTSSIYHDCSLIALLSKLFLEEFLLDSSMLSLNFLGCSEDRKKHKQALLSFLNEHTQSICSTCMTRKESNTLRIFDCKSDHCQQLYEQAPTIIENLCASCSSEWEKIQELLALSSVSFVINHHLVRGLDYYNGLVFEFSSSELGAQTAFAGGGRYTLGKECNDKEAYPSVGVALGIGRMLMLLEERREKLSLPEKKPLFVLLPLGQEQQPIALLLGQALANAGVHHDVIYELANVTNMMKKAQRLDPAYVLLIGSQEQENNTVTLKNMITGSSETMSQDQLLRSLEKLVHKNK